MKNAILLSAALILSASIWAQAPQGISHQAEIKNIQGELVFVDTIGKRVNNLQGIAEDTAVFVEIQKPQSNEKGLITTPIGQGFPVSGNPTEIVRGEEPENMKANDVYNPITGKVWMDRNLGASQVATSSADVNSYGDLYQWGRGTDGHQLRTSGTTTTISVNDSPGHGNYIIANDDPYDWRSPQNDNLWQGVNGVNNPCPAGYRLPTEAEWNAERLSWSSNDAAGALASPLKLPLAGYRHSSDGSLNYMGTIFAYWTSTVSGIGARIIYYDTWDTFMGTTARAMGMSTRCIKGNHNLNLWVNLNDAGTVTGGGEYEAGTQVVISATANPGWEFVKWTGDTHLLDNENSNSTILTMPAFDISVIASFAYQGTGFTCGLSTVTFTYDGKLAIYGTVESAGQCWLDRNLGASRVANSSNDAQAYGDLFQWGRGDDGHQAITSEITFSLSSSDTPGHGDFIVAQNSPWDWRSPQNDNLWQGVSGVNNPCPSGYRLPTWSELLTERMSWNTSNAEGAFNSPLKLVVGGYRDYDYGSHKNAGSWGLYWSGTTEDSFTEALEIRSTESQIRILRRAYAFSVRCIWDSEHSTYYNLNINVDPPDAGTATGTGNYEAGTLVDITAMASAGWEFVNWTGDTDHLEDENSAITIVTMPASDISLTAHFELSDIIDVPTLAELRAMPPGETIYRYTGEAVIVAMPGQSLAVEPYVYSDFEEDSNVSFAGWPNSPTVVENPAPSGINPSTHVAQWQRSPDPIAHAYALLDGKIDFSEQHIFRVKIWSPIPCEVLFKLEDKTDHTIAVEVSQTVSDTEQWVDLTYDFSGAASGMYDKIVIFMDYLSSTDNLFYFDYVTGPPFEGADKTGSLSFKSGTTDKGPNRNRKFIQDETAAIFIFDAPGNITTSYTLYDVITNVTGQIEVLNNMVRFLPTGNAPEALDNTPVEPYLFALDEVTPNDQAKLIKFNNVAFEGIEAGEIFIGGQNYTITDGASSFVLRTHFWDEDYIGQEIPHGAVDLTGVVTQFNDAMQITPRFAADIEEYSDPCLPPDWIPVTGMQYNMQVAAHLYLYDEISFNPDDILGAFVDGECRGLASPDPDQDGLVFLTIGSNSISGETVELVIWDSENCEPCQTWQTLTFEHLQQVGTPSDPYIAECRGYMEFNTPLGQGFTWFSMNVDPGNMHLNTMLQSLAPCENDRVIGQTTYALYHNNQWMGSLQEINPESMYIMELCSAQDLHVLGAPVPSSAVNLGAGFTWLGYIPWDCLPLNTALADLSPQPENNDRVIGQTAYALYHNGNWMGSLTQMCPGKGYVIDLTQASTLQYPESFQKVDRTGHPDLSTNQTIDIAPHRQYTMTVLGQLKNPEGYISQNEKDIVYAMWGIEKRGVASPSPENEGLLFMNIASDESAGELITFVAWSDDLQQYVAIHETLGFESLKGTGIMEAPFVFTMAEPLGNDFTGISKWAIGDAYPNPTYSTVNIPYLLDEPANVNFRLYTGTGQLMYSMDMRQETPGKHVLVLEKGKLPRGVYLYQVVLSNERNSVHKNGVLVVME